MRKRLRNRRFVTTRDDGSTFVPGTGWITQPTLHDQVDRDTQLEVNREGLAAAREALRQARAQRAS